MPKEPIHVIERAGMPVLSIEPFEATGMVKAFFSTRQGGISTNPSCGSLNLNIFKEVDHENAKRNIEIFCETLDIDYDSLVANHETHTNIVIIVDENDRKNDLFDRTLYQDADGLVTNHKNIALFIYGSDCALHLFLDPQKEVIAATHAGWKGSLNGIIPRTIDVMKESFGCNERDILVAISPSIGPCCFEVDAPVRDLFIQFNSRFTDFIKQKGFKFHIDLCKVNTLLLTDSGILPSHVYVSPFCTMCDDTLFHSYRREKGNNGVNGAVIQLKSHL